MILLLKLYILLYPFHSELYFKNKKVPNTNSIKLTFFITNRKIFSLCKEKKFDTFRIKPLLFKCVQIPILIQFAYTSYKMRTVT